MICSRTVSVIVIIAHLVMIVSEVKKKTTEVVLFGCDMHFLEVDRQ